MLSFCTIGVHKWKQTRPLDYLEDGFPPPGMWNTFHRNENARSAANNNAGCQVTVAVNGADGLWKMNNMQSAVKDASIVFALKQTDNEKTCGVGSLIALRKQTGEVVDTALVTVSFNPLLTIKEISYKRYRTVMQIGNYLKARSLEKHNGPHSRDESNY